MPQSLADLTGPAVLATIGELRGGGTSLRTCNSYLRSIKSFSRWLWRHKRRADDPLCALESFNEETDPRHVRRELLPEEVARLLASTEKRTRPEHNLPGPDRAMVYRLALGTGFRAGELRSLTPASFDLDSDPPTVTVAAAHSKRRREDRQPIRQDLADLLRPWLAARPEGERLFARLPGDTARMLRSDLAAARAEWIGEATTEAEREAREKSDFLAYRNAAGEVADFHATRHTYVSGIVAGGASVKTCQELARHSSPSLTIGRYSHARLHDLQGALGCPAECNAGPLGTRAADIGGDGDRQRPADPRGPAIPRMRVRGIFGGSWTAKRCKTWRKVANRPLSSTDEVDKAQVVSMSSTWRESARKKKRGAGGSRTHDGGFAIRCLSHLATAPSPRQPSERQQTCADSLSCRKREDSRRTAEDSMPVVDGCQRCLDHPERERRPNLSTERRTSSLTFVPVLRPAGGETERHPQTGDPSAQRSSGCRCLYVAQEVVPYSSCETKRFVGMRQ